MQRIVVLPQHVKICHKNKSFGIYTFELYSFMKELKVCCTR
jgi:hypothetical protein